MSNNGKNNGAPRMIVPGASPEDIKNFAAAFNKSHIPADINEQDSMEPARNSANKSSYEQNVSKQSVSVDTGQNYRLRWNSCQPGHLVFLIDLSRSMIREMNNKRLVDVMMDVLNSLFDSLNGEICQGEDVEDRFSVTVLGYNSDVKVLLKANNGEEFNTFFQNVSKNKRLFDTGKGGIAEPNWQTFMADAFDEAKKDIEEWIARQSKGGKKMPAPVVINITDGEPNEGGNVDAIGKALRAAENLKNISTEDGNVLLFNIHFTPNGGEKKIVFPVVKPVDKKASFLYTASSIIPNTLIGAAKETWPDYEISEASRAMISNENNVDSLLKFISWGSSSSGINARNVRYVELPKL